MRQFLTTDTGGYTFSASGKTVTFTGGITLTLKQILAIVNTTRNIIIYNPTAVATGGTLSGQVLTLTYDTTTHSNTDQLMIVVDVLGPTTFPAGFQRVTDEPRQIFYDPFDAALDTTNVWTAPTTGNSAVAASVTTGTMSMGTGTTASGWSKLFSIPSFKPVVPAWLGYSFAIVIPDGAAPTANSYRFWGAGTIATTPTTAAPLTDAVGFELDTAGKLYAVVYAGGTRTQVADLSSTGNSTQPLNATGHRYIVYIRTDKVYWYIDNLKLEVASSSFQSPQNQTLPISLLAVGGSTPPVSNSQIQCMGLAVWDTGKNATQLADGTFPFRKATINASGALSVIDATATPAGSNVIGKVGIDQTTPGTTNLVALAANQSMNNAQINGVTPLMGNGITGTGSQRVTIASDNTAFSVNATLAAETTKVIGTIRNVGNVGGVFDAAGQNAASPANEILVAGQFNTTPTTITSGNVSPLQLDSGGKLLVSATIAANQSINLAQVAGTNTVTGGVAGIIAVGGNVANAATATANPVPVGGVFTTSPTTLTTGQTATLQFTATQNLKHDITTINNITPLMGNGITGTGSLRVTIASDNTAFAVNSTLSAETTKVIGTVNMAASQTIAVTQATASSLNATVTQQTLTKGTQGATGVSTQDLKDAGRSQIMLSWEEMAGTAGAESALTNFTLGSKAAAALTAATSYTVTTGKTLRIQSVTIYVKTTSTVNNLARFRIRQAGTVANTSPVIFDQVLALEMNGTYLAGEVAALVIPIPDGLEVAAAQQITFTWFTAANTCTVGMSITGYEY